MQRRKWNWNPFPQSFSKFSCERKWHPASCNSCSFLAKMLLSCPVMVSDKVVSFKSTPIWESTLANSIGISMAKDSSSLGVQISCGTEKHFCFCRLCCDRKRRKLLMFAYFSSRMKLLPPITFLFEALSSRRQWQF